jgi:predicted dehydrogenase
MTRYRGAIIGLGGIATQSHLPAFRRPELARRFEIAAAVDPVRAPERLVDGLSVLADVDRLLREYSLDFVDIATPSATHPQLVRWALEHDLHALCEKPVALTRAEAQTLAALSCAHGRVIVPCHQYRANPVWRRIGQWLEEDTIGRWHLCEIAVYRTQADRGTSGDDLPWRVRKGDAGGGVLLDHGTHLLYTILDLGGVPERLTAWIGTLAHPEYEVEDTAQIRLEYPGRLATLFLTWAARRRETRVHIVGEHGSITWIDGALSLERAGAVETIDCSRELDKQSYAGWFADLFTRFANVLDAGASSALADEARNDIVLVSTALEAAYRSASSGAPIGIGAELADTAAASEARSTAVR